MHSDAHDQDFSWWHWGIWVCQELRVREFLGVRYYLWARYRSILANNSHPRHRCSCTFRPDLFQLDGYSRQWNFASSHRHSRLRHCTFNGHHSPRFQYVDCKWREAAQPVQECLRHRLLCCDIHHIQVGNLHNNCDHNKPAKWIYRPNKTSMGCFWVWNYLANTRLYTCCILDARFPGCGLLDSDF